MRLLHAAALLSLILTGAIFGFFYAWVCSTMWGLDQTDPVVAITAMQAMNASVRNLAFLPAFFFTAPVLLITATLAWWQQRRVSAGFFLAAGMVYGLGGFLLTALINVPLNDALAQVSPANVADAGAIWREYSGNWQFWNTVRTINSGLAL
ncbi:MAG: DUF1772 domain-containing protein, partial [Gammaproteobacteria bacterium]|nr:DUF1772 domain-containing protein [Gammaproteobacteria bacterium]